MSVLGQVLRSLQNEQDGSLNPEQVCLQLVQSCRHAEQHMQGLERQYEQLKAELADARLAGAGQQHQHQILEAEVLAALDNNQELAARLAQDLATLENEQAVHAGRLAHGEKRLEYYRRRWHEAERHYHDLCRQLAMANTTLCVRQTMAAIREHPEVTLVNAKQALAHIRAREQQQCHDEPEPPADHRGRHSADEILARLQQQRNARP
ncbi:hypothetical protein [Oceanimonas baumannii]|uniref:Uncharacterized protein n=1 Tax=Oceanimonas baumannii TaxID=129578 RepID=A0A235CLX2_9GAMM|nr:hypothetical protein [Oceanimonas baumannii]OYD25540.1 hypothetical protein B6S09_04825 [Oceanimonas baumannii]TDW61255.1 hypothetical protein LY04_00790 [Oceanimonas baumannii]